ncbi:NAD(P)H-dependent oxidoreductase [Brevibacterium sp. 50QC2O2]|uniref:FMN-dependent NADH-azoreductase n=1 Tax=Brevibacterium TaxID=1696 RepID=UPI00211C003A|nr:MULTISPECIES: NAD(P)H-dependent oxidoreductase [unclassified Brevibacterium]MCQ9367300.1 NAD(P)H-dependent oxidoreductase [Brevibacterium sp. 91QC2O2]MCQ9384669.1 NAD(P)H-dependent oxidoreductase [Brevibacterium sp. 68QC2CO]MCQ9389255.1 NAD(P)H-dependent oxidoreductase [Brevibacterium sp. 50QC2O2]
MPKLLRIDSSINPDSVSRELTGAFAASWQAAGGSVVHRDVAAQNLPHLPEFALHFAHRPGIAADDPAAALQDELIAELEAADAVVIGAPMYNYSLPSPLKAWLDYLHVPGRTTADVATEGPLAGKPVIVITTRGAAYDDPAFLASHDHILPVFDVLLGGAMGMAVESIAVDRTLADLLPELDPALAGELRAAATVRARSRAEELARTLG